MLKKEQFHFPLSLWAPSPPLLSLLPLCPAPPCPTPIPECLWPQLVGVNAVSLCELQGHSTGPALCFIWLQSVFPSLPCSILCISAWAVFSCDVGCGAEWLNVTVVEPDLLGPQPSLIPTSDVPLGKCLNSS